MAEEDKGKDPLTPPWDPEKKWENPPVGFRNNGTYTPYKDKNPWAGYFKNEPGYNWILHASKRVRRVPQDTDARKHMKEATQFIGTDEYPAISTIAAIKALAYPISRLCAKSQDAFLKCSADNKGEPQACRTEIRDFWNCQNEAKQWIYKEKNCKREYDYIVNCEDARGHILKRCIYERLAYNACVEDKLIQQGYVNPWESNSPIAREHRARELEEFKKAQKA